MIKKPIFTYFLLSASLVFTIIWFIIPDIFIFWLNKVFISSWQYILFLFQIFISNFLHGDIFHFLFNALIILIFWRQLELLIWSKKFIIFFIFISVFNGFFITLLSWNATTIWISWFCMAIISYYVMELKSQNNPEYKWWITALVLNIIVWLLPWISLFGHLFWAIGWVIFYLLNKEFLRKKYIWEMS